MAVDYAVAEEQGNLVATLTGQLVLADTAPLRTRLYKSLAEQPDALLVDLTGLIVGEPLAISVLTAVSRQAARWPGIPVLYCTPHDEMRHLLGRLPFTASLDEARARAAADGTSVPTLIDDLLPITGAARQARNVATEACLLWDLPDLVPVASQIAGELAANVVDHVGTMATLRISLRRRYVMISMRDGSSDRPRLTTPGPAGGRGLRLVDAMAHNWGWLPVEGGKVVWASVDRVSPSPGPPDRTA